MRRQDMEKDRPPGDGGDDLQGILVTTRTALHVDGNYAYVGFFQFLRNVHQLTAFEQAEMILHAALDPAIASRARKGDFVRCLDHCELRQSAMN